MITNYTIFGERNSGTNYLENIISLNFDINVTWKYGWKHFFGNNNELLNNSDNTLFICIVRDPIDWINSFYRDMHHYPLKNINMNDTDKINFFLNNEFWSIDDSNDNLDISKELMLDRNIYSGDRYKNIFELRYIKLNYLLEYLPYKVKNYIFIRYEDLYNDFNNTMNRIKDKGLKIKDDINFPINTDQYKKNKLKIFCPNSKVNKISKDLIINNPNFIKYKYYEEILGYL